MTFSGKMWLMIISKLKKKTAPYPVFRKYIFGKTRGWMSNWTPSLLRIKTLI